MRRLAQEEFANRTVRSATGCLIWLGPRTGKYGGWGRHGYAHREAYRRANGEIPEGLLVLHRCDNPLCVEVSHLFVGSQQDNVDDMIAKGRQRKAAPKSHCPKGHLYAIYKTTHGGCRACSRDRMRIVRAARKVG